MKETWGTRSPGWGLLRNHACKSRTLSMLASPVPQSCSQIPYPDYACLQILYLGLCLQVPWAVPPHPRDSCSSDPRELLAVPQKLPLKCPQPSPDEDEGPQQSYWAWAAPGKAVRGEQRVWRPWQSQGEDRPAVPIPAPAFIGVFSPLPAPPWFFLTLLAVGRDLPARQALSMETQVPVSRARSTMEAKSPLRWGTMEAEGAKQRHGASQIFAPAVPRAGDRQGHVPGPQLGLPHSALPTPAPGVWGTW